jgi:hypothetical protein
MLSVQQCKKHLKNCTYTDQQMEEIKTNLYQLADIFVEQYFTSKMLLAKEKVKQ